jgi:SPW repeat
MARNQSNNLLDVHRSWEDWVGMVLGFLVLFSPWIVEQTGHRAAVSNSSLVGVVLILLAGLEMARLYRWHEVVTLLAGAWLIASPYVLGYTTTEPLATWHIGLGAAVALLAALEIWQDWGLSDDDMAAHGS